MERSLARLRDEQEVQEQYSRRECLRIYEIPEKADVKTDDLVREVVNDQLDIDLNPAVIARSHRITAKPRPGTTNAPSDRDRPDRPKPIIVKFGSYNIRRAVFEAKTRLRGTRIFNHPRRPHYTLQGTCQRSQKQEVSETGMDQRREDHSVAVGPGGEGSKDHHQTCR